MAHQVGTTKANSSELASSTSLMRLLGIQVLSLGASMSLSQFTRTAFSVCFTYSAATTESFHSSLMLVPMVPKFCLSWHIVLIGLVGGFEGFPPRDKCNLLIFCDCVKHFLQFFSPSFLFVFFNKLNELPVSIFTIGVRPAASSPFVGTW